MISIEFFPQKNQIEFDKLLIICNNLKKKIYLSYFSLTFGTGGKIKKSTINYVLNLLNNNINIIPHISCNISKNKIRKLINKYKLFNINSIIVLGGDFIPNSNNYFKYANKLINFIRKETGNWFKIFTASYPEKHINSFNYNLDLKNFVNKINSGSNISITQYFYNIDSYFNFINIIYKLNINIPIIPGIMPIYNYKKILIFSKKCGAQIPIWIINNLNNLKEFKYNNLTRKIGLNIIINLCQNLLNNGVNFLHFYSLNKYRIIYDIISNINFY